MKGENLSVKPQSEMELIESHRNVAPLQFFLFGAPQILLNGDSLIPEISRRAQALLYYLAVTPALQQRSRLASLFWPDVPDVQARKNLRNIVPELRKHLDPFLYITQEVIGFKDRTAIWVDVDLLQRAFADSGTRSKPGQLLAVAHFYRGDFLEGFFVANAPFYEEWITARREQCRHIVVDGLYQSAQQLLESREIGLGMQVARRLLEIERWHEAAHRLIMQFLMLDGQRAAALMHYQRLHTLLLSELGIEPDEVTEALHEELRTVTRPVSSTLSRAYIEVPISVALTQSKHNLLQPTLRLIGRQAEIDLICERLAEENCRLLTLLGETGVGKSKLAYAAAQRIIDSNLTVSRAKIFPDGVWFVPLSAMTTSSLGSAPGLRNDLAIAIACAMKHQFVGSQPLFRQLLLFLRHKATLLILDGVEQLLPEFSACCLEILQASPQIVLLVTATHPLHLATESIFPTPRLALPSLTEEAYLPLSSLSVFSSIDLFLKRAQWLLPSYQLTAANRHDLLQLCRWADGLPAALEVLAALSVSYTPAQLVAALQEQLAVNGAVDAGPGDSALADPEKPIWQVRLLALLTCAWEVLTLTEQQAVLACSVFPDSFLIDAASIVIQVPTTTLVALEQKTFLRRNGQRFMLNHLFRSYVDEKRLQSGAEKRFLRNHSVYYLNQLSTQSAAPKDDPLSLEWFRNELANIRVAWQWAASHDETVLLEKALVMAD